MDAAVSNKVIVSTFFTSPVVLSRVVTIRMFSPTSSYLVISSSMLWSSPPLVDRRIDTRVPSETGMMVVCVRFDMVDWEINFLSSTHERVTPL